MKVEADWSGEQRSLAASCCSADRAGGVVHDAGRGRRSVVELFTAHQVTFLQDCAGVPVDLGTLTVLPPVAATRWKEVDAALRELEVRAERWTVGDLDFLELSVVAEIDEARTKQAALTRYVRSLDLAVNQGQDSKTRQVVGYLARTIHETR